MRGPRPDHSNWPCPGHPLGEKLLNQEFVSRPRSGRSQQTNDRAARNSFPVRAGSARHLFAHFHIPELHASPRLLTFMNSYPGCKSNTCKTSMKESPTMKFGLLLPRLLLALCALICFQLPLARAADAT